MSKQKQIFSFPWHMQKTSVFNPEKMYCSLSFLSLAHGHGKSLPKNICFVNSTFLGKMPNP